MTDNELSHSVTLDELTEMTACLTAVVDRDDMTIAIEGEYFLFGKRVGQFSLPLPYRVTDADETPEFWDKLQQFAAGHSRALAEALKENALGKMIGFALVTGNAEHASFILQRVLKAVWDAIEKNGHYSSD